MIRRIATAFVIVMAFLILVASVDDMSTRPADEVFLQAAQEV